jgi:predicted nucleic acid-binding Zn finger protein
MSDLVARIASGTGLTPELRAEIERTWGTRGTKALAALEGQKVKQYLDFIVVEGATAEYIVDENFCTCGDFLFRERECWHLLAVRLALASRRIVSVPHWYQDRWKKDVVPG